MTPTLDILPFLSELQSGVVCLDVRSPGEYVQGHIPQSLNLPLLNNEERHEVGIVYKTLGKEAAVRKGFELTGHKFHTYIDQVSAILGQENKRVFIYCWRGGLRSNVMAWVLQLAGFQVSLLQEGYKKYRQWCLGEFTRERRLIVISGKTGSGKSDVLQFLEKRGSSMVNLESIARHKGSAFGGLGQEPQPTQEQFENNLGWALHKTGSAALWLEDESRFIGKLRIPDLFFEKMLLAPRIEIERTLQSRIERILKEYGHFDNELLAEKTAGLAKRMGGENVKRSLESLAVGDMQGWLIPLLEYYDKTYTHKPTSAKTSATKTVMANGLSEENIYQELISFISNTK